MQPAADSVWLATERLRLLWAAIQQLLPWHRAAYLLNLRDGELDALPYYGVATVEQIGEALALTPEQYAALSDALSLDEEARSQVSILSGSGQKFTAYWKYLPLEDNLIAGVLNATRPQVIAYRNKAIERLRRQLRSVL